MTNIHLSANVINWLILTAAGDWNNALGVPSVPLRLVVKGTANKKGASGRQVNNVYNFNYFQDSITDDQMTKFQVRAVT